MVTINVSDQLFAALQAKATQTGTTIESIIEQVVTSPPTTPHVTMAACDVTEQVDLFEAERLKLLGEIEQERHLNQMRSEMLSMLSHEFRTPLAIIRSSSDLLRSYSHHLSPENHERKLQRIQEQVDHLIDLLAEISLLTRAHQGLMTYEPESVNIEDLCLDVLNDLRDYAGETHQLRLRTANTNPVAILDPKLIRHALTNLLTNALKYSPDGGDVLLEVRQKPCCYCFTVKDNGIGIPAAEQEKLFQPFIRASNVGTIAGTGIGLAIVQAIAHRHGGHLHMASEVGVGSTFTIEIPQEA
jgi:signal transduction histidine kinase